MSVVLLLYAAAAGTPVGIPADLACRALTTAVPEEAILGEDNTRAIACPAMPSGGKIRYDRRNRVVRARTPLVEGDNIGRMWLPQKPQAMPGDKLMITARIGATTVSREVIALQPAISGRRFFVMGADGRIFAAPAITKIED
jgi:hypothetical protein